MPTIAQAQAKLGGRAFTGTGMSKGVFVPKEDMPLALQMVAEYVKEFESRVATELDRVGRVDTGNLASSITYETTETANGLIIEVYVNDYYKFVDKGVRGVGRGNINTTSPYKFRFLNPSKNGKNSNLGFTMVKEDIDVIKPVLESIGKWNYYGRKQPVKTWRPSINVITNNKRIFNFLIEYDYDKKSYVSADKILSTIPDDLKHYFFRGLIDGDGCFYHYTPKKGSILRQFALTSTYEQNWSYFEGLCNELDIKYKIKRTINTKSSSSVIRITNKDGINKLGTYIYKDFDIDNVGLKRKYNKFKEIIS
jgi:hypothetical protein